MIRRHRLKPRAGLTIVELLVAMTLMGIIGLSALRTFTSQARFADHQAKRISARNAARAPVNLVMSEARMVETGSGVVAASATSVTLRVPVAMGIVCGASGTSTAISLLPVDSVALASVAISGTAYRGTSGAYAYAEGATTMVSGGAATCTAASITTVTNGRTVLVTPQLAAAATAGTPAFIYQRVRYHFAASTAIPGKRALWRTLEATNASEELAAPFDSTSAFRFFRNNIDASQAAVPPLGEIRGLELSFIGVSERARFGKTTPERSTLQTAVFFVNRID